MCYMQRLCIYLYKILFIYIKISSNVTRKKVNILKIQSYNNKKKLLLLKWKFSDPLRSEFIGLTIIGKTRWRTSKSRYRNRWELHEGIRVEEKARKIKTKDKDIKGISEPQCPSRTECSNHCAVHKLLSCLRMVLFSPPSVKVHPTASINKNAIWDRSKKLLIELRVSEWEEGEKKKKRERREKWTGKRRSKTSVTNKPNSRSYLRTGQI